MSNDLSSDSESMLDHDINEILIANKTSVHIRKQNNSVSKVKRLLEAIVGVLCL